MLLSVLSSSCASLISCSYFEMLCQLSLLTVWLQENSHGLVLCDDCCKIHVDPFLIYHSHLWAHRLLLEWFLAFLHLQVSHLLVCSCLSVLGLLFKMGTLHVTQTSCIWALWGQRFPSRVDSAVLSPWICPQGHRWVPSVPVASYFLVFRVKVLISYCSVFQQPLDWKVVKKCYKALYAVRESCKDLSVRIYL